MTDDLCSCCGMDPARVSDYAQQPPWRGCVACYAAGCHGATSCLRDAA